MPPSVLRGTYQQWWGCAPQIQGRGQEDRGVRAHVLPRARGVPRGHARVAHHARARLGARQGVARRRVQPPERAGAAGRQVPPPSVLPCSSLFITVQLFMWQRNIVGVAPFIKDCYEVLGALEDAPDDASTSSSSALAAGQVQSI